MDAVVEINMNDVSLSSRRAYVWHASEKQNLYLQTSRFMKRLIKFLQYVFVASLDPIDFC